MGTVRSGLKKRTEKMHHWRQIRGYPVYIQPDDEGGYFSTVPNLSGCTSQGDTEEECADNTAAAIDAVLELMKEKGGF
jgi:predicted RNase H-like HicB family nuclease